MEFGISPMLVLLYNHIVASPARPRGFVRGHTLGCRDIRRILDGASPCSLVGIQSVRYLCSWEHLPGSSSDQKSTDRRCSFGASAHESSHPAGLPSESGGRAWT